MSTHLNAEEVAAANRTEASIRSLRSASTQRTIVESSKLSPRAISRRRENIFKVYVNQVAKKKNSRGGKSE